MVVHQGRQTEEYSATRARRHLPLEETDLPLKRHTIRETLTAHSNRDKAWPRTVPLYLGFHHLQPGIELVSAGRAADTI